VRDDLLGGDEVHGVVVQLKIFGSRKFVFLTQCHRFRLHHRGEQRLYEGY
jgi:hypothetical protein